LGDNAVDWPAQGGMEFNFLILAKDKWIKSNPQAVKGFMKAILMAENFANENADEAQNIFTRITGYEHALVGSIWDYSRFAVELPQALLIALEDQMRWRMENKLSDIAEVPNYLNYMYFDTLNELKPEAVSMIH